MGKDTMMVFMLLLREVLFVSDLLDMEEYNFLYNHWAKVARNEFNRAQIVQTAVDNMDMCSPIWNAMQDELSYQNKLAMAKHFRKEAKRLQRFTRKYKRDKRKKVL